MKSYLHASPDFLKVIVEHEQVDYIATREDDAQVVFRNRDVEKIMKLCLVQEKPDKLEVKEGDLGCWK